MTKKIELKLTLLEINLPTPAAPIANYLGFVKSGNQVFISGQLPLENGELKYVGKVGSQISVDDAKEAARLCAINVLAQLKAACDGDLDRVTKCIKLGVFVNADANFTDHSAVANGASDLVVEVFIGDVGKHVRAAVGSGSLPRGVAVEVDAIFEIN